MRFLFAAVLLILTIEAHANYDHSKKCYLTKHACKALSGVGLKQEEVCDGREVTDNKFVKHPHLCKCCFPTIPCGSTGCPDGFFQVPGSDKCYKFFDDKFRTWDEADQMCRDEGLVLAMTDNNEIALRNYFLDNLYDGQHSYTWLGAKADGSVFVWEQTGTSIPADSPLWYNHNPAIGRCLVLQTSHWEARNYPAEALNSGTCSSQWYRYYTLCEKV